MDILQSCIGLQALGQCTDYINSEYSIYDIGSAITALGVLLASYQLLNDTFKFRLYFRSLYTRIFKSLSWLSLLFIFIGSIVPVLGQHPHSFYWYSLFWQILAATTFVIGIVGLVFIATTKINNISENDLDNIDNLIIYYLAQGDKGANIVADQLADFFPSLFELLNNGNEKAAKTALLLSDSCLLHSISENPRAIASILKAYLSNIYFVTIPDLGDVERLKIVNDSSFLQNVFNALLSNNDSITARELHEKSFSKVNNGLGVYTGPIFWNPELLMGYKLLGGYGYSLVGKPTDTFNQNYLLFWGKAIDSLFSKEVDFGSTEFKESIRLGFSVLNQIISGRNTLREINSSIGWLVRFRMAIIDNLDRIVQSFPNKNISNPSLGNVEYLSWPNQWSFAKDSDTFLDVIALGIASIIEIVAMKRYSEDSGDSYFARQICIELTDSITGSNNIILDAIDERLKMIFLIRIEKNLQGWYPMFLPIFFHAYGYQVFQEFDKTGKMETRFYADVMLKVKEKLPRISQGYVWGAQEEITEFSKRKSIEILRDILPKNMEYLADKNTLIYYYSEKESFTAIDLNLLTF